MRVLIQWALQGAKDWQEVDAADWPSLPFRPEPTSGELGGADDTPGWISALNVQGVTFRTWDHYAVEALPSGGVKVTTWNDDPEDWPNGE